MKKVIFAGLVFLCAGCATTPQGAPLTASASGAGFYHVIQRDETLWKVSQRYGVDIETLIKTNGIRDPRDITIGQRIFIPRQEAMPHEFVSQGNADLQIDFIWPVRGKTIAFFKTNQDGSFNKGIDIKAPAGTQVVAAAAGYVAFISNDLRGYGKTVIIEHPFGFSTVYAHNDEILVGCGDKVLKGEVIAKVGSTGRTQTSCLHFEIRKDAKAQNPFYYLP
jgi:hypothetical protein